MKVILDLVVNHCSDEHEWFVKAKQDPDCEEAGYFYFKRPEDGRAEQLEVQFRRFRVDGASGWTVVFPYVFKKAA